MKYNLKTPVLDFRGEAMKQQVPPKPDATVPKPGEPRPEPAFETITFRRLIDAALTNEAPGGAPIGAEQGAHMYQIANKIWRSWKVDLTDRDTVLIKERALVVFPSNVLFRGRLEDFLNHEEPSVPLPEEDQDKELEDDEPAKPAVKSK